MKPLPVDEPATDQPGDSRMTQLERRVDAFRSCECSGDCVQRVEMESFQNASQQRHENLLDRVKQIGAQARQSAIAVVIEQLGEGRLGEVRSSSKSLTTMQIVFGALGIGGPTALAIFALGFVAKRHLKKRLLKKRPLKNRRRRRGMGGPPQETFPRETKPTHAA